MTRETSSPVRLSKRAARRSDCATSASAFTSEPTRSSSKASWLLPWSASETWWRCWSKSRTAARSTNP